MNQAQASFPVSAVQIPEELLRSIPRDSRLTGAGKFATGAAIALILGGIAFGVGVYVSSIRNATLIKEMAQHGQLAEGVVTKTYRMGDENDKRDAFLYEFVIDGKRWTGRTEIKVHGSPVYPVGSSATVRYLPARPEANWIEGHPPSSLPLFAIPLLVGGMLAGACGIFFGMRRQKALVVEGRPALARVMTVKRVWRGEHKKQRARIEFALLNGARQEAHIDFGRKAPQPDSTIVIVYDPENPKRVLRYPPSLVRVEKPEDW